MSNETDQTNEMIASATSNVDRIIGKMKGKCIQIDNRLMLF